MKRGILIKFREYLNNKFKDSLKWKHNQFHQVKRGYGDYLYFQDRVMFDIVLNDTLTGDNIQYKDFLDNL